MVEGIQWSPYREQMLELMKGLKLEELKEWMSKPLSMINDFRKEGAKGSLRAYTTEKIEKIALGDFLIKDEFHLGLCTLLPHRDYDLPIFISRWEEGVSEIVFLVDLLPTVDSLIDEGYRKKYFDSIQSLWERFAKLPGICPEEDDRLRSLCSIVYTAARVSVENEGMRKAALAPHLEYLKAYLGFINSAVCLKEEIKLREVKRKRETVRKTLGVCHKEMLKTSPAATLGKEFLETLLLVFF